MILVCGIPSEPPVHAAIDAARRRGVDYAVFDQRQATANEIVLDVDRGTVNGVLVLGDETVRLDEIEGVYARLVESDLGTAKRFEVGIRLGEQHPGLRLVQRGGRGTIRGR